MDAVKNAAPFPRPPASLFPKDLALKLTIVFELT
jgi:protein TonB